MASSSWQWHGRRPRQAASGQASSSRRKKRARYPPPSPVTTPSPPYTPTSPSYSPTSPLHPPTYPSYSPTTSPTYPSYSPTTSPPQDPRRRYGDDVIGEEPSSEGQEDEDYDDEEEQRRRVSEREQEHSDGSDEDDQQAQEEEEEQSESEREEYSEGSDGENGVEDEQQASHGLPEQQEEEEPPQPLRSESEREQEHPDGSDGENGVEDQQLQVGEQEGEEEEEPPRPHGEDDAAAVDRDLVAAPGPPSPAPSSRSEGSVVGEMTVDRTDALDCGICFLPLKPPIFQCDVGRVVCSPCRDKLAAGGRCHVCRDPTRFQRCHAMEKMVDAVRVPCPHAAHGCADRPAYHDRERHARECPRAPCRCPACGFAGPAPALAEHAAAAHGWPCAAEPTPDRSFNVHLRDGCNLITTAARGGGAQHLILLTVARTPFGRAVSAVRVRPQAAGASTTGSGSTKCELDLYYLRLKGLLRREHFQTSRFEVASMDGSDGLPDPSASFQFFVPKCAGGSDDEEDDLCVDVVIKISP